ncbi:hypothetical protein I4U23_015856 [Adineta vaga]|nr:hypothetical protein I4U23_015856 [Adineta vaga]
MRTIPTHWFASFFILLNSYTQDETSFLSTTDIKTITKCTINLFLSLCTAEYEPIDLVQCLTFPNLVLSSFKNENNVQHFKSFDRRHYFLILQQISCWIKSEQFTELRQKKKKIRC